MSNGHYNRDSMVQHIQHSSLDCLTGLHDKQSPNAFGPISCGGVTVLHIRWLALHLQSHRFVAYGSADLDCIFQSNYCYCNECYSWHIIIHVAMVPDTHEVFVAFCYELEDNHRKQKHAECGSVCTSHVVCGSVCTPHGGGRQMLRNSTSTCITLNR